MLPDVEIEQHFRLHAGFRQGVGQLLDANGVIFDMLGGAVDSRADTKDITAKYQAKFGPGGYFSVAGYNDVHLYALCINKGADPTGGTRLHGRAPLTRPSDAASIAPDVSAASTAASRSVDRAPSTTRPATAATISIFAI